MLELTPELLSSFLHNILRYKEAIVLEAHHHPEYISQALEFHKDKLGLTFYIHHRTKDNLYILWDYKAWLTAVERWNKQREDRQTYNETLEIRKQAFREVCLGICSLLGLEKEMVGQEFVKAMAVKVLEKRHHASETLLGIDLTSLPELPNEHIILDEDGKEDYRV
jgi:hypothetical protein